MRYLVIILSVILNVMGQITIKKEISKTAGLPDTFIEKLMFLLCLLVKPWIIFGFCMTFIAAMLWMAALTKTELSQAYPFMGLSFVMILLFSWLFLNEQITMAKVLGTMLIVIGVIVTNN